MVDFCLESRETRLFRGSVCPTTGTPNRKDSPVIFHYITLAELAKEVLVVCNDDKLEVGMVLPLVNDAANG